MVPVVTVSLPMRIETTMGVRLVVIYSAATERSVV